MSRVAPGSAGLPVFQAPWPSDSDTLPALAIHQALEPAKTGASDPLEVKRAVVA